MSHGRNRNVSANFFDQNVGEQVQILKVSGSSGEIRGSGSLNALARWTDVSTLTGSLGLVYETSNGLTITGTLNTTSGIVAKANSVVSGTLNVTNDIDVTGSVTIKNFLTVDNNATFSSNCRVGFLGATAARFEIRDGATTKNILFRVAADDQNPYVAVLGNDTFSSTATDGLVMWVSDVGKSIIDARGTGAHMALAIGGTENFIYESSAFSLTGTLDVKTTSVSNVAKFFNDGNNVAQRGVIIQAGEDSPSGTNVFLDFYDGNGDSAGGVQRASTGTPAFFNASDARIKEEIAPSRVDGLKILSDIELVEFRKVRKSLKGKKNAKAPLTPIGYVAQQVKDVYPEMVFEDAQSGLLNVADGVLIPVLVKSIQQLSEKLDFALKKIETLEKKTSKKK